VGTAAAFALSMLGGALLAKGTLAEQSAPFAAAAAGALGAMLAAVIARGREFRLVGALCSAALMLALLLGLHAVLFGKSSYVPGIATAAIPAAALAVGLIRIKSPRHRVKYC
ncbi:MAG: hypothetical protein IIY16_07125, partial [Oscillospiraceae bacterium]|nr:hypothetical protein [Oscillospiraceae bacterium]